MLSRVTAAHYRSWAFQPLQSFLSMSTYSTNELSLDIDLLASQPLLMYEQLRLRRFDPNLQSHLKIIKNLQAERKQLILQGNAARNQRKKLSKDIAIGLKNNDCFLIDSIKKEVAKNNEIASSAEAELINVEHEIKTIFAQFPNLLDDSVPDGDDEKHNLELARWGDDLRKVGEGYLWHDDIAKSLCGFENEAASRLSGSRFSVLVGSVARLERALIQFFLDFHTARGYTEVSVPFVVGRSCLEGTGQLPKFEEDLFRLAGAQVRGEDAFLIPTAEVPITNLFRGQILCATQLPIRLVAHTPSFRAEAGSNGKDTRGLLRQHQFHKVEIVRICAPEHSEAEHETLTEDAEALLKLLRLPFRRLLLCSGDTGFSARKCYDLEVWLPSQQAYREISSCSNCHDFQTRRMATRFREPGPVAAGKTGKSTRFPHTINGSGLAVGRTLAAILETYHQEDGSVRIPEVLQPYMGHQEVLAVNRDMFRMS